jgi:predicted ATPase
MREKGSRGKINDIGMGGEKLAAYINKMSAAQRNKLNKILSGFIGYAAKTTTETKRPGWVDLFLNENFSESTTKVKAAHISDGILRLLALIAASIPADTPKQKNVIADIPDSGFILLDEIEDGINPYLAEKVIDMLRKVADISGKQVIVTTHSPVILNHFQQDEIVFMWRDNEGNIHAKPMFATEEMTDVLDCFNPGEVWLNYSRDEILSMMKSPRLEV